MSIADFILDNIPLPSLPSYLTHYEPGATPLSTWTTVTAALVSYLVIIFGLRELMRSQQALKMTALFQLHNMLLSSGSLVLLVLMAEEIAPIVLKRGIFYGICGKDAWTPVRVSLLFPVCICSSGNLETRILLFGQLLYQIC